MKVLLIDFEKFDFFVFISDNNSHIIDDSAISQPEYMEIPSNIDDSVISSDAIVIFRAFE